MQKESGRGKLETQLNVQIRKAGKHEGAKHDGGPGDKNREAEGKVRGRKKLVKSRTKTVMKKCKTKKKEEKKDNKKS